MTARHYETPAAFKQALEQRLRDSCESGSDLARRRQLLVFVRFLARVSREFGDAATLKGGLAVELRLDRARTTRDVDLRVAGSPDSILDRLHSAARRDLQDFFAFTVGPDARHPKIQNDAARYDGLRFRAECTLAGKLYGRPFGVDVAFGDPMAGAPDIMDAANLLAFAAIGPPQLRVYPVCTHIAEKLHAYTMPRGRPNSRVKDLPDLPLIATAGPLDARQLAEAIRQTFEFRGTHPVPPSLPQPSDAWARPYAAMALEDGLSWHTLAEVWLAARTFLDPILAGTADADWDPDSWRWRPRTSDNHGPADA